MTEGPALRPGPQGVVPSSAPQAPIRPCLLSPVYFGLEAFESGLRLSFAPQAVFVLASQ